MALPDVIDSWTRRGWLRPLDRAFAAFCQRQRPRLDDQALLGAALVSHQVGRGHLCLDLAAALQQPEAVLGLPPDSAAANDIELPRAALDGLTAERWLAALAPLLADDEHPGAPLAEFAGRIYLARYHAYEMLLAAALRERAGVEASDVDRASDPRRAAAQLSLGSRLTLISGGPGTGKTTTIAALVRLHQEHALAAGRSLRVALAAPTGKATARLQESMRAADLTLDGGITTLHRLLGARPGSRRMRFGADNPLHLDLLVVDEASMVDLELMTLLLQALPERAHLVLVGDRDQLASVEPGAVMSELCGEQATLIAPNRVLLTENFRFGADSGIGALSRAVNAGDPGRVRAVLDEDFDDIALHLLDSADAGAWHAQVIDGFAAYLALLDVGVDSGGDAGRESVNPAAALAALNRFRVLCGPRRGPWGVATINALMEQHLGVTDLAQRGDGWYHGRPVMVTRNDRGLGLYNGDVGVVLRNADGELRVWFDAADAGAAADLKGGVRPLVPNRLSEVETVWGMTVHKSQGSEFERVALLLPDRSSALFTRELLYTGITRARTRLDLLCGSADVLAAMVNQRTHRASGLALRLQA